MSFTENFRGKALAKFIIVHLFFVIALTVYASTFGCVLRRVTGISCPGCGLTRAYLACFRLELAEAFSFHPLFLILPPYVLYMLHRLVFNFPGSQRLTITLTAVMTALLLVVWLIRLALRDPVVAFCQEESLLYDIIPYFSGRQ